MHWFLWITLANGAIMWLEYIYRNGSYDQFLPALPAIIVPVLIGQLGLFYGFRGAPNLLLAGAAFTLVNVALRVVNTYLLGETINWFNWAGVVLLITASFLLKVK